MSPSAETKGETSHSQRQRYDFLDFTVRTMSLLQTFRPTHAFKAIAGAFLPVKSSPGEDVEEDLQGELPGPETLGWESERYWKYFARHRARVARRLGVAINVLDGIEL
jgi:hypothetical protein